MEAKKTPLSDPQQDEFAMVMAEGIQLLNASEFSQAHQRFIVAKSVAAEYASRHAHALHAQALSLMKAGWPKSRVSIRCLLEAAIEKDEDYFPAVILLANHWENEKQSERMLELLLKTRHRILELLDDPAAFKQFYNKRKMVQEISSDQARKDLQAEEGLIASALQKAAKSSVEKFRKDLLEEPNSPWVYHRYALVQTQLGIYRPDLFKKALSLLQKQCPKVIEYRFMIDYVCCLYAAATIQSNAKQSRSMLETAKGLVDKILKEDLSHEEALFYLKLIKNSLNTKPDEKSNIKTNLPEVSQQSLTDLFRHRTPSSSGVAPSDSNASFSSTSSVSDLDLARMTSSESSIVSPQSTSPRGGAK